MKNPLISIIMPAYNAEKFIEEAIQSVLEQSYQHWELLVVNDGSEDKTEKIIWSFKDTRIKYYKQKNQGVGAARNRALKIMQGDFFCFLDADDILPLKSLEVRLAVFRSNIEVQFVDGKVEKRDASLNRLSEVYEPTYTGNPLQELISLRTSCFFGPSWMIKRKKGVKYSFQANLSHAEDLLFYMQLARSGGIYDYTKAAIYIYRQNSTSAMSNLKGLEEGYWQVYHQVKNWQEFKYSALLAYRLKVKKIMFLSYLRTGNFIKAFEVLV